VNMMAVMLKRHMNGMPYRVVCITDNPRGIDPMVETHPLWNDCDYLVNASGSTFPSCYRRLRIFDKKAQDELGIPPGDRIVSIDLDTVIAGPLEPVLTRKEVFVGWAVKGTHHITVFNGSQFMFTAGELSHIWNDFNPMTSPVEALNHGFLGSDQAWLSYKLIGFPGVGGWSFPQVASYPREMLRKVQLPKSTVIVNFHGRNKPWMPATQNVAPWIKQHYRV
jgi:hypothetical protein